MAKELNIIVACDEENGIGKDNKIPWKCSEDLKHFRQITKDTTKKNAVVMGRLTWESMDKNPLPNRLNVIISKTLDDNYIPIYPTLGAALNYLIKSNSIDKIFIIGGANLYKEALEKYSINNIYLTRIKGKYDCSIFFPIIPQLNYYLAEMNKEAKDELIKGFYVYKHTNIYPIAPEIMYYKLLDQILNQKNRETRNGLTRSLFSANFVFDMKLGFPLFTCRKVWLKGIFEELMWMLRGETTIASLQEKGINIWNSNTSREFLDKRGLTNFEVGEVGATYGFNWRHFGAVYSGSKTDYTGMGYDQLENVINLINNDPFNRRILVSLWNPNEVNNCALPPCLWNYQFYVKMDNNGNKYVSLIGTLRSSDVPVAFHWNTAHCGLLLSLICKTTGAIPDMLYMNIGDTHIYEPHWEDVVDLFDRKPMAFPRLTVKDKKNIIDYQYSDIVLDEYYPNTRPFKLKMVA